MHERLLTIHDVSDYLGIPIGTLYQWRYTGKGPGAARLGRHLRYRSVDVDAWLEARIDRHSSAAN